MVAQFRFAAFALCLLPAISSPAPAAERQMADELRAAISRVVVVPGSSPTGQEIGGTYEEVTPGFHAGAAQGASLGNPSMQVGGVTVSTPVPILTLPGAIVGGLSGHARRELQEFRDALTEEIADASRRPLAHDRLARQVYQGLRGMPKPDASLLAASTPVPESADAVLYARVTNIEIEVDENDAILTTTASMTIERRSDGSKIYDSTIHYQDRAALSEWTKDEHRLFTDYANFALYWLGEELAAEAFARVDAGAALQPVKSGNVKPAKNNPWSAKTKAAMPELAWAPQTDVAVQSVAWPASGERPAISYELQIFDNRRPVHSGSAAAGSAYQVPVPLEPCKTYRWSVRPVFSAGGIRRFGAWMQVPGNEENARTDAIVGRNAAVAPAFLQDFASLEVHCRAK